jgi:hypothetical protein
MERMTRIGDHLVHHQAIETALMATGVPDLNMCFGGTEVWVECKRCFHWKPAISEFQVGWLLRRARAGGRCFVMTRRLGQMREGPYDEIWIHRGSDSPRLRAGGLRAVEPLLRCHGPVENWCWESIGQVLVK